MIDFNLIETIVITIIAALLGLSLPLIMQSIERLDSKYGSAVISSALRKNWKYKTYFWLVWITIALMIYLPFAPEPINVLKNNFFVVNSAHICAIFALSSTLLFLLIVSLLIMTYESPENLLSMISGVSPDNPNGTDSKIKKLIMDKDKFDIFGTVMKFSMRIGNTFLFLNCNAVLGACIGVCRKNNKGKEVIYPDVFYNLNNETLRICQRYYDELLYPSLNSPQTFLAAYFDESGQTLLSRDTLRQLWVNLCQLVKCDKPDWFKGYWVYATQYADYFVAERQILPYSLYQFKDDIDKQRDISSYQKETKENWDKYQLDLKEGKNLRLFHHMISAYLLYQDKISLLKWTFTYAPSSLRTLFLLPKDIAEIIKELSRVNNDPFILESNYSFFSQEGISEGYFLQSWLIKFYIFALQQQSLLHENGIYYKDPWNLEELIKEKNPICLNHYLNAIRTIQEIMYPESIFFDKIGINIDELEIIFNKLQSIKSELLKLKDNLIKTSHLHKKDKEAAEHILKSGLTSVLGNMKIDNNKEEKRGEYKILKVSLTTGVSVNKNDFIYSKDNFCQNSIHPILLNMNRILMTRYIQELFKIETIEMFHIDHSEIQEALDLLKLKENKTFNILPIDINPSGYSDFSMAAPLYGSGQAQLLITKDVFIPSVSIDEEVIPKLTENEINDIIFLNAIAGSKILVPPTGKCIRLIIVNSLFDGRKSEIDLLKPIMNLNW